MSFRLIARLDVKGPNLVKGVHLEGLRALGAPEAFAHRYYEHGIDELLYMDVVASLYGRNSLLDVVERTARTTFVPLTVGGGLRSVDDIRAVLRAGADKVALNTAALQNPELIARAAKEFGSSTIVVSIEAIRRSDGVYEAFTDNGREHTGVEVVGWAIRAAELGAGEVMVTSVDREGTGKSFDLELVSAVSEAVPVPVIAGGGAGRAEDVVVAATEGHADAAAVASVLHYDAVRDPSFVATVSQSEGNDVFLQAPRTPRNIEPASVGRIRELVLDAAIPTRSIGVPTS